MRPALEQLRALLAFVPVRLEGISDADSELRPAPGK
jgi:hypothetical protein